MTRVIRPLIVALMLAGALPAGIATAQGFELGRDNRTIGVLDQERMYTMSLFGQRVRAEVQAAYQALEQENDALLADLSAREEELTDLRSTLPPEEFRSLADAFDADVEEIRTSQDRKLREINGYQEQEEQRFFAAASPLISALAREAGLQVLLDKRNVILVDPASELTDQLVLRLNQLLGTGAENAAPPASVDPDNAEPGTVAPDAPAPVAPAPMSPGPLAPTPTVPAPAPNSPTE